MVQKAKTVDEINRKIMDGDVVVVTADETVDIVNEKGAAKAAEDGLTAHGS